MKVGLSFDLRNPPEWRRDTAVFYQEILELVQLAEELGIDGVWVSEHHFIPDEYIPSPLVFLSAIAARTRTIELGAGIIVMPFYDPIKLAEDASVLDLISGGRLNLGIASGYRPAEFAAFGKDHATRWPQTRRGVERLLELLAGAEVTPGETIQPRSPGLRDRIWIGARTPGPARLAGRHGLGLHYDEPGIMEVYRDAYTGDLPGRAVFTLGYDNYIEGESGPSWKDAGPFALHRYNEYRRYLAELMGREPRVAASAEEARNTGAITVMTPTELGDEARRRREIMPELQWFSLAGFMPGQPIEQAKEYVRMVANEVVPAIRNV